MPVASASAAAAGSSSSSSSSSTLAALPSSIPPHFQEAQHSLANHRKNVVSLYRMHASAARSTEDTPKGTKLVGEKAFNDAFLGCLNRLLGIKKGVVNADRGIKFVAAYSTYAQSAFRAAARKAEGRAEDDAGDDEEEEEDTSATRFVAILIKHLLRGFSAKNKNVRLRCCQTVALLINGLESMDDDLYETLRMALLLRAKDRESAVRVQAVVALAKLQTGDEDDGAEHDDDDEDEEYENKDVTGVLLDVMRHDPSAEVRRAALFNLTPTSRTLPYLLERLRDIDAINRRCVYLGTLSPAVLSQPGAARIGKEQWDDIVKVGLGEREETVRRAAKKLIKGWMDSDEDGAEKVVAHFNLLRNPDVVASALNAAFEVRPSLLDTVAFDEPFWGNLTPSSAFIGRIFVEHCKTLGSPGERKLEETMPLVTALAFRTQAVWGSLLEALEAVEEGEESSEDQLFPHADLALARQSILDSLLRVAMAADYGDEIGRRKVFGLVRDMISSPLLPEALLERSLDLLLKLSAGQRDFVRIVVELVQEMGEWDKEEDQDKDELDEEEAEVEDAILSSKPALSPEEAQRQAAIDARRLIIVRGMLERVVSGLHENTAMHGVISQLIAPAIKSKDALVREQGLLCLGLCCMLDGQLALQTFSLFIDQVQKAEGNIKLRAVQIVFDALVVHGIRFLCSAQTAAAGGGPEAEQESHNQILMFLQSLLEDDELEVQAAAAEGLAKLMLAGVVQSDDALRSLVLVYMSPETIENQELRQCLSYFLPVYCYSGAANQRRLQRVFVDVLQVLTEVYNDREDGQEMVTPMQVGLQLLDWTDHEKAAYPDPDDTVHVDVAFDLVKMLYRTEDKDERKVMCQLLGKLSLPETLQEGRAASLLILTAKLQEVHPPEDTVSRNALSRFEGTLIKRYPDAAASIESCDLANAPELEEARAFLDFCEVDLVVPSLKAAIASVARTSAARGARNRASVEKEDSLTPSVAPSAGAGARGASRSVSASSSSTTTTKGKASAKKSAPPAPSAAKGRNVARRTPEAASSDDEDAGTVVEAPTDADEDEDLDDEEDDEDARSVATALEMDEGADSDFSI